MRVLPAFLAVLLLLAGVVGVVSGCSTGSQALVDTARSVWGGPSAADSTRLNPGFRYLRVSIDGRAALLVLGYVDAHPRGRTEVWYSAEREVLKLQNGRVVGVTGLTTEWRRVALPALPDWTALLASTQPFEWTRTRDVMPGYRYGVEDRLTLKRIDPPDDSRLVGKGGKGSRNLIWFEEIVAPDARGERALPPVRYALDPRATGEPVVYGEVCLARDLCFAWQRWPVSPQRAVGAR